jgi:hypothetical protein
MNDENRKHGMRGEDWGPEEVKEILDVVAEKIPNLLESLSDILYSKENAQKYGDAVAHFYKSLLEAGMTTEQAFELTEKYMSSLSPLASMGGMLKEGKHFRSSFNGEE